MLHRFNYLDYLDTEALSQYIAALESDLAADATKRSSRGRSHGGGVDARLVRASRESSSETEEERNFVDTHEARFERLLRVASEDPESLGWVGTFDPDTDFRRSWHRCDGLLGMRHPCA